MGYDELRKLACCQCMGLITNLVEHCSANAEAMNSNSVDALNFFRALFAFA